MLNKTEKIVVAGLIKKENKFLLAQRLENDEYGLLWEFPGGGVEEDETNQEALIREFKEELAINVSVGELVNIFYDENINLKIKVYLYCILNFQGEITCLECKDYKFVSLLESESLSLAPLDKKIVGFLGGH